MKKIILHIGTHKTGSSAIQSWLTSQRDTLKAQGVLFARTDRPPNPELPKHCSLFRALVDPAGDFATEWRLILDEFESSGCHTLILSEEGLGAPRPLKLAPLRDAVGDFETTVIVFFRRQDYLVESLWNQLCKEGKLSVPVAEFARRPYTRTRLQYDRILDFWAQRASVKAIAYGEDGAEDSVARFAAAANLRHDGAAVRENPSPSMNCAAFCSLLNRCGLSALSPLMPGRFRADRRRYALGRNLRSEILAEVAESNRRLAEVYGVGFSDTRPVEDDGPIRLPSLKSLAGMVVPLPRRSSA